MKSLLNQPQTVASDLERVIEPLANYVCAADQPKAALRLALALLCHEVKLTNRVAFARVAALTASRSL